jgi:RimJ/RimL family protein N-acetyltransferase
MTLKDSGELIGCMAIEGISKHHRKGEIAYWVAIDHWSKGYCTEAGHAVVKYAFEQWGLNKITSRHKATNPASGKVMQKLGMTYEGTLRQEMFKDGEFCDLVVYGLLKSEYPPKA